MKKLTTIILFLLACIWQAKALDGEGTVASPYLISTYDDLKQVKNNLTAVYRLTADIDASASKSDNGGKGFEPIGKDFNTYAFTGKLYGDGHTISNLTINRTGYTYIGLFGCMRGGEVDGVGLINVDIKGYQNVGALVGWCSAKITNCYSTGVVSGNYYCGGLIGLKYSSTVLNCYSKCDVDGGMYTGGLIGQNASSTISSCFAAGNVNSTDNTAGGLVGENKQQGTIINSYATGTTQATNGIAGGLAGRNESGSTISNSHSIGLVSGGSNSGGLIGINGGTVSNSYWNTETSGQTSSAAGGGKTKSEMVKQETYTGWDFSNVWEINEGKGYPYLQKNNANPLPDFIRLTISGSFGVGDKEYDGINLAMITSRELNLVGVEEGDDVELNVVAIFESVDIGTAIPVNLTKSFVTGADADKYVLSLESAPTTTAAILRATTFPAPPPPVLLSNTNTAITLVADPLCEYSMDNGVTWQESNVFTGLIKNTTYNFIVRYKATTNYAASAPSIPLEVTTLLFDGEGTEASPYLISTYEELKQVKNSLNAVYRLTADIDASVSALENGGKGYIPIGNNATPFNGKFYGGGYAVNAIYIRCNDGEDLYYVGLFGCIGTLGEVDNLLVTNADLKGDFIYVGALAGYNKGKIKNSYTSGSILAPSYVGGLVGENDYSSKIESCYSSCSIERYTISGFMGSNYGGLVGCNFGNITNSYAVGSVNGGTGSYTGGLAGSHAGSISNCYSIGKVTGTEDVGGMIGALIDSYSPITKNSYWNTETSGQTSSAGGTGKTTSDMQWQSAFESWDFSTVWTIAEEFSYPGLRGVNNTPFAFDDTFTSSGTFALSSLLGNDYDIENGTDNLVVGVISCTNGTATGGTYTFASETPEGTVGEIIYKVGEKLGAKTLWGNTATAKITLQKTITDVSSADAQTTVSVYPNPVTDILNITTDGTIIPDVWVYSLQGELLQRVNSDKVDMALFAKGAYLVVVNGEWFKVIKQ